MQLYYLSVNFYNAKGLAIGDVISSDPYLVVMFTPKIFFRTRPIFCTLNPTWDEVWHLSYVPINSVFPIEIWDYDVSTKDDLIGTCQFVFSGQVGPQEITVMHRGKSHGLLNVKVTCEPMQEDVGDMRWIGPAKYEIHTSYLAGRIINHRNDDETRGYATYKLTLPYTLTFFQQLVSWNQNYEAAKKIFAQGVKSTAIQQVIKSQHKQLYMHDGTTIYGTLANAREFLELLNGGRRKGIPRYYTYVIVDTGMYFSETGASFFTDFMSKHAMHANASDKVYFAGEFHIQQPSEGKYILVLDNNSGTYAPPKESLPKLRDFFEMNFVGLAVEAYDREDEKLKEYKKIMASFKAV